MKAEQIVHDVASRVREIVAEAEARAAEIVRDAEAEAERIRARAEAEGHERLEIVRRALDELESRVAKSPSAKESGPGAPSAEISPGPVIVPEPSPAPTPEPGPTPVPEPTPDPVPEPTPPPDEGTPPQVAAGSSSRSDDAAAARLVAMNMALDGASREQIEGHLAENYSLPDAGAVVDDVLALATR
jgi:hypothetical protein